MKKFTSKVSSSQKFKSFNKNLNNIFYFFLDLLFIVLCTLKNLIKYKQLYKKEMIIVSAASEAYYEYLMNLLKNLSEFSFSKIIIYDLGLSSKQVLNLEELNYVELVKFEYSKYPSFISEKEDYNQIGSYAWKPVIIKEVFYKYKTQVVWLDSANLINKKFIFLKIALSSLGFFSTYSIDSIEKWTHDSVIKRLKLDSKLLNKVNLNGAVIGFDYDNKKSREFLKKWEEYCLQKELISPVGSTKANHRHDQTLLSILFYRLKLPFIPRLHTLYGVKTHQWHDRIYYIVQTETKEDTLLRENWYKHYGHISTNNFTNSKKVIFLNGPSFKNFKKRRLRKKISYVILSTQFEVDNFDWKSFKHSIFDIKFILQKKVNTELVPSGIIFSLYEEKKIDSIVNFT